MKSRTILTFGLVFAGIAAAGHAQPSNPAPLVRAHAHNDYEHDRPLLDALDHGFCSIEVDVFESDGALLVGHDSEDLRPERTIQALYLDPLLERVRSNGGRVYTNGPGVILLVDFKTDGERTYAVLRETLESYREMLTSFGGEVTTRGAVTVVISGSRPIETISADPERLAAIDGRLSDLDDDPPVSLYPLISQSWRPTFNWIGRGEMPADQREKLDRLIERTHSQGRILRFWAIPANPDVWAELLDAGVDLINVDNLSRFQSFLFDYALIEKRK